MQLSHFETPDGYLVIGTHNIDDATEHLRAWRAGVMRRKAPAESDPPAIPEYVTPRKVNTGHGRTVAALEFTR